MKIMRLLGIENEKGKIIYFFLSLSLVAITHHFIQ
jgi:hypothetical protein